MKLAFSLWGCELETAKLSGAEKQGEKRVEKAASRAEVNRSSTQSRGNKLTSKAARRERVEKW